MLTRRPDLCFFLVNDGRGARQRGAACLTRQPRSAIVLLPRPGLRARGGPGRAAASAASTRPATRAFRRDRARDLTVAATARRLLFLLEAFLGLEIHRRFGDLRQQLVRVALLVERLLQ